mmetsp:Transcript_9464/g.23767  ORF Transcript_9464/g.23767 Transcript_9464/m.23767 type:complete len:134 (+) Transcript_9464:56-457(+)
MSSAARKAILQLRLKTKQVKAIDFGEEGTTTDAELMPPNELHFPDAKRYSPLTTNAMFKKEVSEIYLTGLHIPARMSTPSEFERMMKQKLKSQNFKRKKSCGRIEESNMMIDDVSPRSVESSSAVTPSPRKAL